MDPPPESPSSTNLFLGQNARCPPPSHPLPRTYTNTKPAGQAQVGIPWEGGFPPFMARGAEFSLGPKLTPKVGSPESLHPRRWVGPPPHPRVLRKSSASPQITCRGVKFLEPSFFFCLFCYSGTASGMLFKWWYLGALGVSAGKLLARAPGLDRRQRSSRRQRKRHGPRSAGCGACGAALRIIATSFPLLGVSLLQILVFSQCVLSPHRFSFFLCFFSKV